MLQMELHVYSLSAVHMKVNTRALLLIFYDDIQRIFQHLRNQMDNNALRSLPTGSLGTYVECVIIERNMMVLNIYHFGKQKHLPCIILMFGILITPRLFTQFVQNLVRINN